MKYIGQDCGGTYVITNTVNDKVYYGSTSSVARRCKAHRNALRRGKHDNRHLQAAFSRHGEQCFEFALLASIGTKQGRIDAEQRLLDQHWDNGKRCYNASRTATSCEGRPFSRTPEETRKRLSDALNGRHISPRTEFKPGRVNSPEFVAKLRVSMSGSGNPMFGKPGTRLGKPLSAASRARISKALRGVKTGRPPPNKGIPMTDEQRKKVSAARKGKGTGRVFSPETRARISAAKLGVKRSAESRAKMSASGKLRVAREREERARLGTAYAGKKVVA